MRGAILLAVQIVISLVVAATLMPIVLAKVPAARSATWGPVILLSLSAGTFVLLWIAWRPRKS